MALELSEYIPIAKRLAAGGFVCLLGAFINCLSQVYIERVYLHHALRTPLFDIGFEFLPWLPYPLIADGLMVCAVLAVLGTCLCFHPKRSQILRRCMVIVGGMFLTRSFTIVATILPNPLRTCITDSVAGTEEENVVWEALRVMTGQRTTCGDCLYSGHAANTSLAGLIAIQYGRYFVSNADLWRIVHMCILVYCFVTYVLIVCTRFHYTIDVVVGVMVIAAIWKWYHGYIKYLDELPPWHPIAWYEFDLQTQEAKTAKPLLPGDLEEQEALKLERHMSSLDDPDAPLVISLRLKSPQ